MLIRKNIEVETLHTILKVMENNSNILKNGFNILSEYEKDKGFYYGILTIIFLSKDDIKLKKLSCSSFNIFIKKNWSDENYITNEEKLVNIHN